MPYRLREIPSEKATLPEIADFMEYQCLKDESKIYSVTSGVAAMGIVADDCSELGDDNDCDANDVFYDALAEIENRKVHTNGKYPFNVEKNIIKYDSTKSDNIKIIYTFLLLATRENMSSKKVAADIDGTALFERLCAIVLQNFFGVNSHTLVFGTGSGVAETFKNKVERLLNNLGEDGYTFRTPEYNLNREQDGKVDVVTFIPFCDRNKGQFMAFGQCKTGISWRNSITQLRPDSFSKKYISPTFFFTPIAVFMVCESFYENWETIFRDLDGLLFDRERIMEYVPDNIDDDLLMKINKWNNSVIERDA